MAAIATDMTSADGWVTDCSTNTSPADGRASKGSEMVAGGVSGSLGDRGSLPPTHPEEILTPMDERNRTLELAKYFAASQTVPASQGAIAIGDDEVAAAPSAPAADTTLTALAQLGAFKLACDRAFISLINSTHQYIIGEATQSTSLLDNALRPEDGLCLGVRALELAFGVCPQTIQIFTSDDRTIDTPNVHADSTCYVIKDFTADSQFKDRPYVTGWPHMRSYAEVPLKSSSGYVVGSYCVVDTRPREFDDSEIQILDSVGVTIMNHLELLKSQLEFHRVQRLVRGIGSYAAGYSGLHEHQTRLSLGTSMMSSSPRPVDGKKKLPLRLTRGDSDRTVQRPATHRVNTEETVVSLSDTSLGIAVSSDKDATGPESKLDSCDGNDVSGRQSPAKRLAPDEKSGSLDCVSMPDRSNSSGEAHEGTTFSMATSTAVSRASHLIRQSMDLAGKPHAKNAGAHGSSVSVSTMDRQDSRLEDLNCVMIGHSVDIGSAQDTDGVTDAASFTLSHNLLERLLERHPFGHVFSYDDFGAVLQPYPSKDGQERRHPSQAASKGPEALARPSEADDAAELLNATKGARSIAFATLWDYRNDRWFAASIGWTVDPLRIFDASELNYLSAFGNSITAEVSRLEVSALSKAKSDFISSISHEMRSPLHGILASTEILRDTMKLESEVSMLNSIDACGSMLLDTINHLLDYSKITNSSKRRTKHVFEFPEDSEIKANGSPVTNLSTLVHDVVEGVFLGNVTSENASDRDTSDDTTFMRNLRQGQSDQIARKLTEPGDVVTLIDIDPSVDWRFKTEGAAWKRIVMNLFGNAMKFTKKGQITVKLHLARRGSAESEAAQHIRLEVHDTGSGIDKDYLTSHLFTAFSQADDISVGTGVGLSIVKRLVEELNGFIDVQSDHGIGTRVYVAIPLGDMASPVNGPDSIFHEQVSLYANGRHKGHVLCLRSPALDPTEAEREASQDSSTFTPADAGSNVQTLFANLARYGFGMSVVELASLDDDQQQSDGGSHLTFLDKSTSGGAWTLSRPAHGASGDAADGISNPKIVSIRQPFGPRTFASALDEIMAFTAAGAGTVNTASASNGAKEEEDATKSPSSPETSPRVGERQAPSPDDNQEQHLAPVSETHDTTARTQASNPQPPEEASPSTHKTAPHLLLVDDNAVNLRVLVASAKKGGCTYDQAADGRQAVDAFKSSPVAYDLVLMDLSMPVLDGIEATREIRGLEEERKSGGGGGLRKRTRIIALTALDDDRHRQRAFEAGVDDFITKPVKMARVRELARLAWAG